MATKDGGINASQSYGDKSDSKDFCSIVVGLLKTAQTGVFCFYVF